MLKIRSLNTSALAILLVAIIASVALTGCGSKDKKSSTAAATAAAANGATIATGPQPPPIQVSTGNQTGVHVSKPTVYLIHSQRDYTALLARHNKASGVSSASLPSTNFKQRQIVGVFAPKNVPGTTLYVDSVQPTGGKIVVDAVLLKPGAGCHIEGKTARPYAIVDTGRMKGDATLKLTRQRQSPC